MWNRQTDHPLRRVRLPAAPLAAARLLRRLRARAARRVAALPALLAAFAFAAPAHAERTGAVEVAMVTDLAGKVERQPQRADLWSRVGLDDAVALFDAMRTWESSTAELRFVDGTVVMLDEKTRLRISAMLFDASRAPQEVQLALAAGSAEVRAGSRRLWVDDGSGAPRAVEPGAAVRLTVGQGGVEIEPPGAPIPVDFERGTPTPGDRPAREPAPGGPRGAARPFDPAGVGADPTEVLDEVVDGAPGGAVGVALPGAGVVVLLPSAPGGPEMPGPQMPGPDGPGLPDLPATPDGLLRDLLPGGFVTGLDDLPPLPTGGRVRVEVEIRRQ